MKGLVWEVSLRNPEFMYRERGDTPEEALANLRAAVEKGIAEAQENVDLQRRRLDGLSAYLRPGFLEGTPA